MPNASDPNFRYIPEWLLGVDLTQIGVYPIQRQSDGKWAYLPGTLSLSGSIDRIELVEEITHQVIKPVNRRLRNEVIVEDGWSLNLVEILKTDIHEYNVIPRMMLVGNQFAIYFTAGLEAYYGWYRRGAMRHGITDEGRNTVEMSLRPMDVGYPSNLSVNYNNEVSPFMDNLIATV